MLQEGKATVNCGYHGGDFGDITNNMLECNQQCTVIMGYMVCSGMEDGQEINPVYNPGRTGNEEYPNTSQTWDLERGMQYPQMAI